MNSDIVLMLAKNLEALTKHVMAQDARLTEIERYLPKIREISAGEIAGAPYRLPSDINGADPRMNLTTLDMRLKDGQ